MTEEKIKHAIFKRNYPRTVLFNNPVGDGLSGPLKMIPAKLRGLFRRVKYGLYKGSSDLIGWKSIEITPEMIGQRFAVFVSVEVKKSDWKPPKPDGNKKDYQHHLLSPVLLHHFP